MSEKSFIECIRTGDIPGHPIQWVEKWLTGWKETWEGLNDDSFGSEPICKHFGMTPTEWDKFVNRPNCLLSPKQIGSIGITTPEEEALAHLHFRLNDFFSEYECEDYVEVAGEGLKVFRVYDSTDSAARLESGGISYGWESFSKLTRINYRVLEHTFHRQCEDEFHLNIVAWDNYNSVVSFRVAYDRGTISIRRHNSMGEAIYLEKEKKLGEFQWVVHQFFDFYHLKKFLTFTSLDFRDPNFAHLRIDSATLIPSDPWEASGIHPLTLKDTTFSLTLENGIFKLAGEDGTIYLENSFGRDSVTYDDLMEFFEGKVYTKIS